MNVNYIVSYSFGLKFLFFFQVKELFGSLEVNFHAVELDVLEDGAVMQAMLLELTGQNTVPNVFINKKHLGGCDKTLQAHEDGLLKRLLEGGEMYDYDLIVIGGGSGGLAVSKEAASYGRKVLVLDYVVPTPSGTTWGLGGTCVNVGCIPKKLMHQAALLGEGINDSHKFGWEINEQVKHNWLKMTEAIHTYIGSLNWSYRVSLRDSKVTYINGYAEFVEPHKIQIEQLEAGTPGRLLVSAKSTENFDTMEAEFNTVLVAVGRDACTKHIGLDKIGVFINQTNGKIPVNDQEQTNMPHVYAIGDVIDGKLELTPVAIQAGKLLAHRLYGGANLKCDYVNVCTTVFTPLEYGCCGLTEDKAVALYDAENIEVFHSLFKPLEWAITSKENNACFAKIICNLLDNNRVVGFHLLGPNAGEITQGFGAAIKCGITKQLLDTVIGIHPTCAEVSFLHTPALLTYIMITG
uniref:Thioredoxin reductase 3 n=1 Tax=Callorhinchus milii TaxID=7868 RepID=A0A4W3JXB5_CALMI